MTALMKMLVLLGLLAGSLAGLTACENTFRGIGQDIEDLEEGEPST